MGFHVTDTTKSLAATIVVVKMGNRIENVATGDHIRLRESGATCVFDVEVLKGAEEAFSGRG